MICTSLIYALANPLIIANQATGKVKRYQAVCGSILLLILPVSYIVLKLGFPAYSVFIVHFVMESITQLARMIILRPLIGIRIREYFKYIYTPVILVVLCSVILPFVVYESLNDTILRFFTVCIVCVISVVTVAYTIGLSRNERIFVRSKAVEVYHKIIRK